MTPSSSAAGENNFLGAACIEEFGGALSGGFEAGGMLIAQFVNTAMDIGIIALVVIIQRLDDRAGFLGRGGVVEINQRLSMDLLVQDGKVCAKFFQSMLMYLIRKEEK